MESDRKSSSHSPSHQEEALMNSQDWIYQENKHSVSSYSSSQPEEALMNSQDWIYQENKPKVSNTNIFYFVDLLPISTFVIFTETLSSKVSTVVSGIYRGGTPAC